MTVKVVSDFKYLVSWANSTEKGIEVRKSLAWKALNDMSSIWSSNLSRDLKIRVFQATIESVLLYGCEGWSLTVVTLSEDDYRRDYGDELQV